MRYNNYDNYINSTFDYTHVLMCAKEELPTWDEMYFKFWLNFNNESRMLSPDNKLGDPDKYWEIDVNKYILGISCNQINRRMVKENISKRFILINASKKIKNLKEDIEKAFASELLIYAPVHPKGDHNIFALSNYERINLSPKHDSYMAVLDMSNKTVTIASDDYILDDWDDYNVSSSISDAKKLVCPHITDIIAYFNKYKSNESIYND